MKYYLVELFAGVGVKKFEVSAFNYDKETETFNGFNKDNELIYTLIKPQNILITLIDEADEDNDEDDDEDDDSEEDEVEQVNSKLRDRVKFYS